MLTAPPLQIQLDGDGELQLVGNDSVTRRSPCQA
jgi:hypothetical protein